MTRRAYGQFDRMRALAAFEAYNGDFELTARYTHIGESTLRGWSGEDWWTQELHDSAPIRDKRHAEMRLHVWDCAFRYVQRLMSPEVVKSMPVDKLAIAFGILIDKMLLLEKAQTGSASTGDVYTRLVEQVFGKVLEDHELQTRV